MLKQPDRPQEASKPIVTHVTQVTISLEPDDLLTDPAISSGPFTPAMMRQTSKQISDHYTRVITMMELLKSHGFSFRADKQAIHCFSTEVEAGEAKRLLLAAGFKDREFQIVLDYTRGWGML
jgi:hypothetical protein